MLPKITDILQVDAGDAITPEFACPFKLATSSRQVYERDMLKTPDAILEPTPLVEAPASVLETHANAPLQVGEEVMFREKLHIVTQTHQTKHALWVLLQQVDDASKQHWRIDGPKLREQRQ